MSTIFTKIINREIPASIVYEDEKYIAFLSIEPFSKGHTVFIPKKEYARFLDMPIEEYLEYQKLAQKLAMNMKEKLKCNISLLIFGEQVEHVHINLFGINDELEGFDNIKIHKYENGEMENYKNKLRLN